MAKLPYSRVVDVNLSRTDRFPSRRGFGTPLLVTSTTVAGQVDSTHLTKLYATIQEVAVDFAAGTTVYNQALAYFSQNPRPVRLKVGWLGTITGADTAAKKAFITTALNAILNFDPAWYVLLIDRPLRDAAWNTAYSTWIQSLNKLAMIDTNDVLMYNSADTTNNAYLLKGTVDRTAYFFHDDANQYLAAAAAAYLSTRNFDDANSAYTLKFKKAIGIPPVNLSSAQLTTLTGFVEATGQAQSSGNLVNTYIDIGDQDFIVEGGTLTQNVFVDEIHATDWIIARTEEEALALFLNNAVIPFTDQGLQQIASVPRWIMQQGLRAGIVANDLDPLTGDYKPAVVVTVPSVFSVSAAQRNARIAPAIEVIFRYAGAVHYTTINYTMTF